MFDEDEARLPAEVWIDAVLRKLQNEGHSVYIVNKGAYASGTVLLKINGLGNGFRLLSQIRNIEGELGWMHALGEENPEELAIDTYISRAISRDPDIWVIEIESRALANPFDGKLFAL